MEILRYLYLERCVLPSLPAILILISSYIVILW